jgi:hypothetical protein
VKLAPSFQQEHQDSVDGFNRTRSFDWTRQHPEIMMDADRYMKRRTSNVRMRKLKRRLQELQLDVPESSDS